MATKRTIGGIEFTVSDQDSWLLDNFCWHLKKYESGHVYLARAIRLKREEGEKRGRLLHIYLHREILGLKKGDKAVADHINGDTTNNTRENLRAVTRQQNATNRRLKACGVKKARNGWSVTVVSHGERHYIGYFQDKDEAATAYEKAAEQIHGEYTRT